MHEVSGKVCASVHRHGGACGYHMTIIPWIILDGVVSGWDTGAMTGGDGASFGQSEWRLHVEWVSGWGP